MQKKLFLLSFVKEVISQCTFTKPPAFKLSARFSHLFVVLLTTLLALPANTEAQTNCIYDVPNSVKVLPSSIQGASSSNDIYYLKIYVHAIRLDNGSGGATPQQIDDMMAKLAMEFNPYNIFFVWDCYVNNIPSSAFYNIVSPLVAHPLSF